MELSTDGLCRDLDVLIQCFLENWAEEIGQTCGAPGESRLFNVYPQVITQLSWARTALGQAGELLQLSSSGEVTAVTTCEMAAVFEADGAGAASCCPPVPDSSSDSLMRDALAFISQSMRSTSRSAKTLKESENDGRRDRYRS
ncbi:hypothetical protein [Pannonibacter indicus]|uniref:hypothetical protein n=1 Tax=Pannonibacter indicus TaxID=466044 RepID=UPI00391B5B6F